jgi:hypothetical protein
VPTHLFADDALVFIAVHHGQVMDKMLQANALPFITVYSGDYVDGSFISHRTLRNEGVGPARKALHHIQDFFHICCNKQDPKMA